MTEAIAPAPGYRRRSTIGGLGCECAAESTGVRKAAVGGYHMLVRVEPLKFAEGVHGYGRAEHSLIAGTALTQIAEAGVH
jgi:hypothetical protein